MAGVALTIVGLRDTAPDVLGLDEITTRDVRGSLQELSNKLSQSAFFLSSPQLTADEARGSAAARRRSTIGRAARRVQPVLAEAQDVISVDATKFAKQERRQQRAYNAVVAREEAQNEQYTDEEARYRKIRAHAYLQQYQGFLKRRKLESEERRKFKNPQHFGGRAARHGRIAGSGEGGPPQKFYH